MRRCHYIVKFVLTYCKDVVETNFDAGVGLTNSHFVLVRNRSFQ